MKAWQIGEFGIEKLEQVERPDPEPGRGQVVVRVRAASLNYRDLMMVKGLYNPRMKLPRIPCSDGAGEVAAVGEGVTRVKVGERVAGTFFQNWVDGAQTAENVKGALGGDVDGMLTELALLREDGVVHVPMHLSDEEAATLPCAGLTAWNALHVAAQVKSGETVVVQGTGGVSMFALQFGRLAGARVIGTSSSDEKLDRAKNAGLDAGVNYRKTPEWDKWVQDQTGGAGADVVVEVGGVGTFAQSLKAVRLGGTVTQIGVLAQGGEVISVIPILQKAIRVQGIYVGSRRMFEDMNRAMEFAGVWPMIDRVFDFEQAREALQYMESGGHFGKIVIRCS